MVIFANMKIAIYGAGSLGTVLGAYLSRGGLAVELVHHNDANVKILNEKGVHVVGTTDFVQPVKAITPEEMTGKYDRTVRCAPDMSGEL